jgi:hypothetical protein
VFAMLQFSLTRQSILVPSLRNMEVTEKKDQSELKLIGEFGNVPGKVSVGGQAVQVKSWGDTEIVVALPNSGAASSGPVLPTVDVGGGLEIKGNAVPLSDWRGTYRTRYTASSVFGKPGPWSELQCTNFHFRGDIHQYRVDPEGPAMAGTVDAKGARSPYVLIGNITADSVCGGLAGGYGDQTYGNTTLRAIYNGLSAGIPWVDNAVDKPEANWFFGDGSIQPDAKILILNTAGDMYGVTFTQMKLAPPPAVTLGSTTITVGLAGLDMVGAPIPLALDSGFNASSGTRTFQILGGDKADLEYNLHVDPASLPTADTEG